MFLKYILLKIKTQYLRVFILKSVDIERHQVWQKNLFWKCILNYFTLCILIFASLEGEKLSPRSRTFYSVLFTSLSLSLPLSLSLSLSLFLSLSLSLSLLVCLISVCLFLSLFVSFLSLSNFLSQSHKYTWELS
jgi:hypothetical protein